MPNKEKTDHLVSLRVSFITPISADAKTDKEAEKIARAKFKKIFDKFTKELDDIADVEIEIDFIEDTG